MSSGLCASCLKSASGCRESSVVTNGWVASCAGFEKGDAEDTRLDALERRIERIERLLSHKTREDAWTQ